MLKKILVGVVVVFGGFAIYVSTLPSEMNISRELEINASAEVIFPFINNSKKGNEWMPWRDADPGVKMVFSGPEEGVGAKTSWDSQGQMGTGEALITESVKNQSVKTQLTYTKPFEMSQQATMSLSPAGANTKVRWGVTGKNNFLCKAMSVFMNMEKMVGGEFEKGLQNLKKLAEAQAKVVVPAVASATAPSGAPAQAGVPAQVAPSAPGQAPGHAPSQAPHSSGQAPGHAPVQKH